MAASINDLFNEPTTTTRPNPATTTAVKTNGASSVTVDSTDGWATATAVHFTMYEVDADNEKVANTQVDYKGIVNSSTTINNLVVTAGTDREFPIGSKVICAPTAAWGDDLVEGLLVSHDQDGTLKAGAVDATAVIADGVVTKAKLATAVQTEMNDGWTPSALPAVSSVTYNGNRSYSVTFGSSVASTLSPQMRLRIDRATNAPTQCTSLNGSTQYWVKTSPNKLTFTDDFVVSAWVKLSSYANASIASRYNGTSGWDFGVNSSGQLYLVGLNGGSGNTSNVVSYQSLPLNKWVHVTAQLDMSSFTATTTTSYTMIDGTDVPASVSRAGTNPTALVQAGNLEIGSRNSGTQLFPGKIAQVAIFNAKVTQSTIRGYISQGLTGSETSLASAYSFNNSTSDLNTTTPNDLSAGAGSPTATNADSPFSQDSTTVPGTYDYGLVMAVSGTTATVQVPEGCTIPTTGSITTVDYATSGVPLGFPLDKGRWEVTMLNRSLATQATPTTATWYNLASQYLTIPAGSFNVFYEASTQCGTGAGTTIEITATLSTSSSTDLDKDMSSACIGANNVSAVGSPHRKSKNITNSTATIHYLLVKATGTSLSNLYTRGDYGTTIINATPAGI